MLTAILILVVCQFVNVNNRISLKVQDAKCIYKRRFVLSAAEYTLYASLTEKGHYFAERKPINSNDTIALQVETEMNDRLKTK